MTRPEHRHYFRVAGWVNYKICFLICSLSEEVRRSEPAIRREKSVGAVEVGGGDGGEGGGEVHVLKSEKKNVH